MPDVYQRGGALSFGESASKNEMCIMVGEFYNKGGVQITDQAFREATSALASWLEKDYALTGPEAAILLGATIQYQISEVADRNVGVVAKIRKQFLPKPEPKK